MSLLIFLLSIFSLSCHAVEKKHPSTYYVSCDGNDNLDGLTPATAWKTISRVNKMQRYHAGDRILFRRGDLWKENISLSPKGDGNRNARITIGAWGNGEKPRIIVTGKDKDAVVLCGQSFWSIEDIFVSSAEGSGIAVNSKAGTTIEGISISRVEAYDCSPHYGQREFGHCGIRIGHHNKSPLLQKNSRFVNILLDQCVANNCATGIMVAGKKFHTDEADISKVSHDVLIENCIARNLRGDGIIVFSFVNAVIRNCLCYNSCTYSIDDQCTAAIWTWNVKNGLVRGCESYGHVTPGCDRNPFDSDYNSTNVVFEDNFGHDSYGSAILMCAPGNSNDSTEFRNNKFRNCGYKNSRQPGFIWFYDCDKPQQRSIRNNQFVCQPISKYGSTSMRKSWCTIENNVFIAQNDDFKPSCQLGWEPENNTFTFDNNTRLLDIENNLSDDFSSTDIREISLESYTLLYNKSIEKGTDWRYGPKKMTLKDKYTDHCDRVKTYRYYENLMADYQWKPSNTGGGGYIIGLLQSPSQDNVYYARCDVAGVFRSTDNCKTWLPMNGGLTRWYHHYVRSIALHPHDSNIVFRCSGDNRNNKFYGSVHKSDDGGNTWREVLNEIRLWGNGHTRQYGEIIRFDKNDPHRLVVADYTGQVFLSTDTGENWKKVFSDTVCFTSVCVDNTYYASTNTGKMYASYDKGENWAMLSETGLNIRDIIIQKIKRRTFIWITTDKGILRSSDEGKHFKYFMNGLPKECTYIGLAVDPTNPQVMVCAQDDRPHTEPAPIPIYKTENGGQSWHLIKQHTLGDISNPPSYYTSIEKAGWAISKVIIDRNNTHHILFSNWYGVCESNDGGLTYDAHGFRGLETCCLEYIECDQDNPKTIAFSLADHRPMISYDNGENYSQIGEGNYPSSSAFAFLPDSQGLLYGAYSRNKTSKTREVIGEGGIIKIDSLGSKTIWRGEHGFIQSLKVNRHNHDTYYAYIEGPVDSVGGIWRSFDNGNHWERTNSPFKNNIDFLPYNEDFIDNNLLNIVVGQVKNVCGSNKLLETDIAFPHTIYVGERSTGLYKSENDGDDWTDISGNLPFQNDTASVLSVIHQDKTTGYLYAGFIKEGLWVNRNRGNEWEKIWPKDDRTFNISSIWTGGDNGEKIVIAGEDLYWASMNPMVAISNDRGLTFENIYDKKLGALRIKGIDVNPKDGRIFVITSGNGAFYISKKKTNGKEPLKIIYVNSYHKGYPPSDSTEQAIREKIAQNGDSLIVLNMDCKRNADKEYSRTRGLQIWERIKKEKPDGIVVSDDDAVKHVVVPFMMETTIPTTFCGVNWDCKQYGLPHGNITGIIETLPLRQLLSDMLLIIGDKRRIAILSENSLSEQNNTQMLDTLYKSLGFTPSYYLVDNFSEWKEALKIINDSADIVYMPTNGAIKGWNTEYASSCVKDILQIPSITCDEYMMPYCTVGYIKNPKEQGEEAINMLYEMIKKNYIPQVKYGEKYYIIEKQK